MAIKGLLPAALRGERGVEGTPTAALLFSTASILVLTPFPFSQLIELNMALYAASLLLEQLALLRLRWSEPELRRPYRIPLNRRSLCILFAPQLVMCVGIIAFSMRTLPGVLLWAAVIVSGLLLPRFGRQCFGAPARESRTAYSYHAAWSGASRFSAED